MEVEDPISLQQLYEHPLVAEIISENQQLRATLQNSERPNVKDLKEVPLPYTIKHHLCINEGVHNGTVYSAQMLRMAVDQHEGLQLYVDHHDTATGGTVQTWIGAMHNPVWSESDKAILSDLDIVDPKYAMALAYGAKFGISAVVDVELNHSEGKELASDPIFKAYGMVIDPAVRETMLNSESEEKKKEGDVEKKMGIEELDIKSDLKPALDKLDDAIRRASAMKDTSLLTTLQQTKAIIAKLAGTEYPYPKPGKMEELEGKIDALEQVIAESQKPSESSTAPEKNDLVLGAVLDVNKELVGKFAQMEQAITSLQHPAELEAKPEVEEPSVELEAALKENETMKTQLASIEHDKLVARTADILNKELEVGLILSAESEARRKELETMDSKSLDAVEQNIDKTIELLNAQPDDSKPEKTDDTAPARKELGTDKKAMDANNHRILAMMVGEQGKHKMPLGGYE